VVWHLPVPSMSFPVSRPPKLSKDIRTDLIEASKANKHYPFDKMQ
jgi:hypothetical protein